MRQVVIAERMKASRPKAAVEESILLPPGEQQQLDPGAGLEEVEAWPWWTVVAGLLALMGLALGAVAVLG